MNRSSQIIYNADASLTLVKEIMERSGQNLLACYQCRRCAAGCPAGEESGDTPDRLIRMILLGEGEAARNNPLVSKCIDCYTCGARCPNSIHSARITETLHQMSKEAHRSPLKHQMIFFYDAFMTSVKHWGRFNEIEAMVIYETKSTLHRMFKGQLHAVCAELSSQVKLGVALIKRGRMHFTLDRISKRKAVKSLFQRSMKR